MRARVRVARVRARARDRIWARVSSLGSPATGGGVSSTLARVRNRVRLGKWLGLGSGEG